MDMDGPPPAHEPQPLPILELGHRSFWRSNFLRFRFGEGAWSGTVAVQHWLPDSLRENLARVPGAAVFLAAYDRTAFWATKMIVGCAGACVASAILTWFLATTSDEPAEHPLVFLFFALTLLSGAVAGTGFLVLRDSFRMFLKSVDAYNAYVLGAVKEP